MIISWDSILNRIISARDNIRTAINSKGGSLSADTGFEDFAQAIESLPEGSATISSLTVTENGTYEASGGVDGYSPVTVNVPIPFPPDASVIKYGVTIQGVEGEYTRYGQGSPITSDLVPTGYFGYALGEEVVGSASVIGQDSEYTITPSDEDVFLFGGVFVGDLGLRVLGDSNLKPENIKSGVTIFGKTGQYAPATSHAEPTVSINSSTGVVTASHTQTAGYIASDDTKSKTLSLTTKGAETITPGTTDKTIASGRYLTGVQTIKGDANLLAENIKKDVSIFGILGTLEAGGISDIETGTFTPTATTSATATTNIVTLSRRPKIFAFWDTSVTHGVYLGMSTYVTGALITSIDGDTIPTTGNVWKSTLYINSSEVLAIRSTVTIAVTATTASYISMTSANVVRFQATTSYKLVKDHIYKWIAIY